MRFATVDGRRMEATPRLSGQCPSCGKVMIAKCGTRVIWHWAHKGARCDGWWEPETAWHRAWKDQFPTEWQEFVCEGDGGERHIADVFTSHGLVIEFQYSRLTPQEQAAREAFYPNLVWVVDGTRLATEAARFMEFKDYFHPTHMDGIFMSNFPRAFPSDWSGSKALVLFDFSRAEGMANSDLWCLFPRSLDGGRRLVAPLPRDEFVRMAKEQDFIFEVEGIMMVMAAHYVREKAWRFGR